MPCSPSPSLASAQAVRDVTYSDRQVIPVKTQVRFTTVLVLPEGEEILDFVCGDKDFWIVSGAQHLAYVKPAKEKAATNLNLVTASGRVYSFLLRESTDEPDLKVYVTPEEPAEGAAMPLRQKRLYRADEVAALRDEIDALTTRESERVALAQRELDERVAQVRVGHPVPRSASRIAGSAMRRRSSSRPSSTTARRPTFARVRQNCRCSTRSVTANRTS